MKKVPLFGLLVLLLTIGKGFVQEASAQNISVKTNALYWATASPNLSAEVGLAPHWTLEVGGGLNPFTFKDNRKWKHYQWQGEARYWLCERFYRHFIGLHAGGGELNVRGQGYPLTNAMKAGLSREVFPMAIHLFWEDAGILRLR